MSTDERTTTEMNFNLPGIGIHTDWASQYRENFKKLDDICTGFEQIWSLNTVRITGPVTGVQDQHIENFSGTNLEVDANGNLNATEATDKSAVVAAQRRRFNTPTPK